MPVPLMGIEPLEVQAREVPLLTSGSMLVAVGAPLTVVALPAVLPTVTLTTVVPPTVPAPGSTTKRLSVAASASYSMTAR